MFRNTKTRFSLIITLSLVISLFVGFSGLTTVQAKDYKVAMIVAQGGLGDQSYNDLAYTGLTRAGSEFDSVSIKAIESNNVVAQGERLLRTAAQADFDLVLTLEFSHADALSRVAPDFPDTHFAIVNTVVDEPNVTSIMFNEHTGSFLAGALAAMVTNTPEIEGINSEKKIGVIGGTKSVGIDKFLVGYEEGAHYIDPDVEVIRAYANAFGDPAMGRQMAMSQFEQGADIVYHVAGGTGTGVIRAAEESGHFAIGVDTDQDDLAPGNVLTSMIKRVDSAVYDVVKKLVNGTLEGGVVLRYGLAKNGVSLSDMKFTRHIIPNKYLDRVEEIKQKIIDGEIEVTDITRE